MNKYGRLAQKHWTEVDPNRVESLEDPQGFFSTLGQEVESRIQELQTQLAGPDEEGETYLQKVGRLNMSRLQAEEIALHELVWITPEDTETDPPSEMDNAMWAIHNADPDNSKDL